MELAGVRSAFLQKTSKKTPMGGRPSFFLYNILNSNSVYAHRCLYEEFAVLPIHPSCGNRAVPHRSRQDIPLLSPWPTVCDGNISPGVFPRIARNGQAAIPDAIFPATGRRLRPAPRLPKTGGQIPRCIFQIPSEWMPCIQGRII
jgi:hypothetical protein